MKFLKILGFIGLFSVATLSNAFTLYPQTNSPSLGESLADYSVYDRYVVGCNTIGGRVSDRLRVVLTDYSNDLESLDVQPSTVPRFSNRLFTVHVWKAGQTPIHYGNMSAITNIYANGGLGTYYVSVVQGASQIQNFFPAYYRVKLECLDKIGGIIPSVPVQQANDKEVNSLLFDSKVY
jgi:hypothetical protein